MSKLWEHMSRDEKLDYIRDRLDSIDASLGVLAKQHKDAGQHTDLLAKMKESTNI